MTGLVVLAAAVVAAVAFGLYRARVDGRFHTNRMTRTTPAPTEPETTTPQPAAAATLLLAALPDAALGERATLLQFSSAFCAPCRATRRTLAEVAELVPGVTHVEVDAEAHLGLVRSLEVQRTPTTLVLDATGREVTRAAGAPRKEQVLAALTTT